MNKMSRREKGLRRKLAASTKAMKSIKKMTDEVFTKAFADFKHAQKVSKKVARALEALEEKQKRLYRRKARVAQR